MFDRVDNLTLSVINRGPTKLRNSVMNRKTHLFVILSAGSSEYAIGERTVTLTPGTLLFIPQGESYEFTAGEGCAYTYITFYADMELPEVRTFSLANYLDRDRFDARFAAAWNFGNPSDRCRCYAAFWSLLSYLSGVEHLSYADKKKFSVIEPAVTYLKTAIFDQNLSADKLHALCGISDTYFRKIFEARFGASPIQYITARRLAQAKAIIDSGDYDTIAEVATSVGFRDPLYFSRAFKKKFGASPSEMGEEY